jgi:ribose 5-phosphate isomerase B
MNIYIVSDHAGVQLKNYIVNLSYSMIDLSPSNNPTDDYPDFAKTLAKKLKSEPDSLGIAICGSGQGICMAINKFEFIRAGLVFNKDQVENLKLHNNANVLCLSQNFTKLEDLDEILTKFIFSKFSNEERHVRRINKLFKLNKLK